MTIDVETVLTHAELADYLGGQLTASIHLAPRADLDTAKARQWALDEVLGALAARTPPIEATVISVPRELHRAVTHKTAERLYFLAMSSGEQAEVFHAKWKAERIYVQEALAQLRPTVATGVRATTQSYGISRR